MLVGIGTPESAREFAERTGFPVEKLYVDESRALYKALELHGDLDGSEGLFFDPKVVEGVRRLFFNSVTGERIKGNEDSIKSSIKNYKPLMPKESRDTVQQGGTFVFKGTDVVHARKDEATADHAPSNPDEEARLRRLWGVRRALSGLSDGTLWRCAPARTASCDNYR